MDGEEEVGGNEESEQHVDLAQVVFLVKSNKQ